MPSLTFDQLASFESSPFTVYKHAYIDMADGDLAAGILLARIIYWFGNSKNDGQPRVKYKHEGKLCLIKTRKDWWDECRITERVYDRCIKLLEDLGFIKSEIHWHPYEAGKRSAFLFINKEKIMEALIKQLSSDSDCDPVISKSPISDFELTDSAFRDDQSVISSYKTKEIPKSITKKGAKRACVDSSFDSYGSHVKLRKEQYEGLEKSLGETILKSMIDRVNDYCAASRPQGYSCYAAAIRNFVARQKENSHYLPKVKPSQAASIQPSAPNELADRLAIGGRLTTHDLYKKIKARAERENKPDNLKGWKYQDDVTGEMVFT